MPEAWGNDALLYNLDHDMFGLAPKPYDGWEKTALGKQSIKVIHNPQGIVFDIPQEIALTYFLGKKQAQIVDVMDGSTECLLVVCK